MHASGRRGSGGQERKSERQKGGWNRKEGSIDSRLCPSIKETQKQSGLCGVHISDRRENGNGNSSAKNLRAF